MTRNIQASTQLGSTVKWLVGLAIVAGAGTATAQSADDYRGGWRTDDSDPHTYEFSIRGDRVRGVYCTRCSDATTLAFVDGTLGADGLTFVVTHVRADGSTAYRDQATAKFSGGKLVVTGTSGAPGGVKFQRTMYKDSRGPDPLPIPVAWIPGPTLAPLSVREIPPGAWLAFRTARIANRGNLEEYKHPCLVGDLDFVERLLGGGSGPA